MRPVESPWSRLKRASSNDEIERALARVLVDFERSPEHTTLHEPCATLWVRYMFDYGTRSFGIHPAALDPRDVVKVVRQMGAGRADVARAVAAFWRFATRCYGVNFLRSRQADER